MFNKVFKLFLLLGMVVNTRVSLAQKSIALQTGSLIKGVLVDSTSGKPIAFGTVIIRNRNNQKIGVISNENGSFRFKDVKPETYTLQASFIGYHTKTITGLVITKDSSLNLDSIPLVLDNKILQRVDVTAHTNLVEDKGDKIVYYAESDIGNQGGNAVDVLRKTPIVSVDAAGNVQMLGSESIKVLINGKSFSASTRRIGDALKMIPANSIKSIEIITSPSSRYDSEGIGGVINIITRKNHIGTNGSVTLTGGNLTQNISTSYSLQTDKFGIDFDGSYGRNIREGNSSFERIYNLPGTAFGSLVQRNEFSNTNKSWEGDLGLTYDLDSLNMVSFSLSHWGEKDPNLTTLYYEHSFTNEPDEEYRQDIDFHNPFGNLSSNLAYTHYFKHRKQQLEIISQYSITYDDYKYTINRYDPLNSLFYREFSQNESSNREWTVQADYTHPFDSAQRQTMEVGGKLINRDMNSDYEVDDSASGTVERLAVNPSLSNAFDYTQRVLAAYTTFKLNTQSGWLLQGGARLEYTEIHGSFKTSSASFKNDYFNLIPSVTVSRKIHGRHTIKASFTQRLLRPQVWNLNPYVIPTDPNNITMGNPELKPELSHFAQFSFSTSTPGGISINSNMYWRQSGNAMQNIVTVQSDGKALSQPENAGHHRRIGVSMNLSSDILKTWSISTNAEAFNAYLQSSLVDFSNRGWFFRGTLNTTFKLPKSYMLQLSGNYSTGGIWLQKTNKETYYYSASLRKDFFKDKAFLTVNVDNPFNNYNSIESTEYASGFETYRINNYMSRSFRLSLNWKFGHAFSGVDREAKKVVNDDSSSR